MFLNREVGEHNMEVKSAYIHIPFCVRICTYCDFNKYFIHNQPVDEYLDCLIKEMQYSKTKVLETVFVVNNLNVYLKLLLIFSKSKENLVLKQIQMN